MNAARILRETVNRKLQEFGIDGLALRNEGRSGQDREDPQYVACFRRREFATSAAALARTSRGDSQNPHSNSGGNQSRAERAVRSRLRQACDGTAEAGVTTPNIRMMHSGASSNQRSARRLSQQPRGTVPFWTYFRLDTEYTQFRHSGNMMPPESEKRTDATSSAPEVRGAVFQPVTSE